jgi:PQQ-like domain
MKYLILVMFLAMMPAFGATRTDTTVAFYHGTPDRAGNYIVPGLDWESVKMVHRAAGFDGRVDGHIYTQPLYWQPQSEGPGLIVTATESDFVYALDAATGRVVWRTELGRPVSEAALPCGNIDPLGITGTPVIDAEHGRIYLDAMIDDRGAPRHLVYGLQLTNGSVLPGFPVDVAAGLAARGIRFNSRVQNQRGALALLNGRILVPFGGHFGDCGDYHGMVVTVSIDPPQLQAAWVTRALKGGIWAPAGLSEADGALFFATGNTEGARDWHDGEGVFRETADLRHSIESHSFFAPSNWKQLDDNDLDLGGVTPLPLTAPGSPTSLLLAMGKDGYAYLLDRANLGGIGGALATLRAARGMIITAAATYPAGNAMVVAYQASGAVCPNNSYVSGIGALAVTAEANNRLRSAWCARLQGRGSPIVTTTDGSSDPIVWAVGAEGDDQLHGFRGDTGEEIYNGAGASSTMTGLRHFATILVAAQRFYVAGDGRIFAFDLPR